jgi:hypothetical protein
MAFAFDETSCDGSQIANAFEVDVEVGREENELLVHHGQERLPFDDSNRGLLCHQPLALETLLPPCQLPTKSDEESPKWLRKKVRRGKEARTVILEPGRSTWS